MAQDMASRDTVGMRVLLVCQHEPPLQYVCFFITFFNPGTYTRCFPFGGGVLLVLVSLRMMLLLEAWLQPTFPIFNPHQRCGYSDSPFARKDTFLFCRDQKWVCALWAWTQKEVVPKTNTLFCYRKIYRGRQTG